MKRNHLLLGLFVISIFSVYAQNQYEKIKPFDIEHDGWAMVEQDGMLGFIDATGKEVVSPQYDKINPFDVERDGWAGRARWDVRIY